MASCSQLRRPVRETPHKCDLQFTSPFAPVRHQGDVRLSCDMHCGFQFAHTLCCFLRLLLVNLNHVSPQHDKESAQCYPGNQLPAWLNTSGKLSGVLSFIVVKYFEKISVPLDMLKGNVHFYTKSRPLHHSSVAVESSGLPRIAVLSDALVSAFTGRWENTILVTCP